MRIAILSFHYSEYALSIAKALAESHKVLLLLDRKNVANEVGCIKDTNDKLNILLLDHLTFRNPGCIKNVMTIACAVRQFQPDVVHCQEIFRDYLALAIPFLYSYPCVLTIHDHKPHSGIDSCLGFRKRIYRYFLRRLADAVIVHGDVIKRETEALMPWLRGKVHSVPHGVLGMPSIELQDNWEQGLLLFFGRINKYKGLPYLVEAVELLKSWGISVRVLIAGTGPDLIPLYEQLRQDPVFTLMDEFIPFDRIPELFQRANIVVLPYTDATQSGVAAFALNYGRPIVASDVGSLREMVRHGDNGLLVPPCNSVQLAKSLASILTNREEANRMARNSFILGRSEFSWKRLAESTISVYKVAQGNRKLMVTALHLL